MKKIFLLCFFLIMFIMLFTGCNNTLNGSTPSDINTSAENSTTTAKTSETTALSPVIEQINAFLKKDTTLKESDIINIFIRNIVYNDGTGTFEKDFKVYLDGKQQTFHDVKPVGKDYYQITVDIAGITAGNVYVKYGELNSNQKDFKLG